MLLTTEKVLFHRHYPDLSSKDKTDLDRLLKALPLIIQNMDINLWFLEMYDLFIGQDESRKKTSIFHPEMSIKADD